MSFAVAAGAQQANVGTTEKEPRPIELIARGPAGHGSVPSRNNAVARLSAALARVVAWTPPLQINETTVAYFRTLSTLVPPDVAQRYRDVLNPDPKVSAPAADGCWTTSRSTGRCCTRRWFRRLSMAGYRYNVIPSEAKAIVDVRLHPEEDQMTFLDRVRAVVDDPSVEVRWFRDPYRPAGASRLNTEAFSVLQAQLKAHYGTAVLPDDGHRRDRYGASALEGDPVLRHRSGHRHRGRREGIWRAQRPGANPGERAAPVRTIAV